MNDLIERQAAIDATQKWTPCNKKLPEPGCDVLVQFESNMCVGSYYSDIGWRVNSGGNWETEVWVDDEQPIAWMPLPEPYKPEHFEQP